MIHEFMSSLSFPMFEKDGHRYVDTGPDSSREPVLFLHGMLGDVSNWNQTMRTVHAEGFRAVAPVLPCYTIEIGRANLTGLVRYVVRFLDSIGLDRFAVVGNSLGGHLAVILAARYPERISALVLTGASGICEVDLGSSIMRRKDREYLRKRVETTFYDPTMCTDRMLDGVISIVNTREYVIRLISIARSVQSGNVRKLLGNIEAPTLLLWGREDRITTLDVAESFEVGIPDARLEVIERCGHTPMMERPHVFCDHLLGFLDEVAVADSAALAS